MKNNSLVFILRRVVSVTALVVVMHVLVTRGFKETPFYFKVLLFGWPIGILIGSGIIAARRERGKSAEA